MIETTQGDILKAEAEALVNTVNCVGVMGRGIALQFRRAFPENYRQYKAACDRGEVKPGRMLVHDLGRFEGPRYIINFPTKRHWKGNSRIEDIKAGLDALVDEVRRLGIRSIAVPPLGCGLGGLDWRQVYPMIVSTFSGLPDLRVIVYTPSGLPAEEVTKEKAVPRMTEGRAALVGLVRKYLAAALDPTVTLLEVHKLMYFMQEAGEPLRLQFEKGPYGPYGVNLRHVLSHIDGHFINGYGDGSDRPDKQIVLSPSACDQAAAFLVDRQTTQERFDRVADLIEGFETPFGMELLATVHWVATREGATQPDEAANRCYEWNDRKRMFSRRQIEAAWDALTQKGWIALPRPALAS